MNKVVPYPLLTLSIIFMWLLLNSFTLGQFLLATLVGIAVGRVMLQLKPEKVRIKSWKAIFILAYRLIIDITKSNIEVTKCIFSGGPKKGQSGFAFIPLELKSPVGLAVLACLITATPGTAWVAYDAKRSELLLHVLDLKHDNYWRDFIKSYYESLLLEVFG